MCGCRTAEKGKNNMSNPQLGGHNESALAYVNSVKLIRRGDRSQNILPSLYVPVCTLTGMVKISSAVAVFTSINTLTINMHILNHVILHAYTCL